MKKVAITGGLSCGKSTVCQILEMLGAYVVSADDIVHQLLSPETSLGKKVVKLLGPNIVKADLLDRKEIAKLVFDNPAKLGALEGLVHPSVRGEIQRRFEEEEKKGLHPLFVAEIPLLFENGLQNAFDLTINISARNELRIKRIIERDGITKDSAQKRINSQMPELDKQKLADIKIVNESDLDNLFLQFQRLLPHLKELKKKDKYVLLAQAKTCTGWELKECPVMCFYSLDFGLVEYLQALGRIQRIDNPKKNLYVYLVVKDTVDEKVYQRVVIERKDFHMTLMGNE